MRFCPRLVAWRTAVAARSADPVAVLGATPSRLRRSGRTHPRRRARSSGRGWEPHRPGLHRRSLRRLPLRRPLPGRLRQPAREHVARRRPHADRRLHHRCGPVRAAGEQADPGRAGRVPPLPRAGGRRARIGAGRPRSRRFRMGRCAPRPAGGRIDPSEVRPRRRGAAPVRADARRRLPPKPAERVHRPPHRGDVRRGPRPGEGALGRAPRRDGTDGLSPSAAGGPRGADRRPRANGAG